MAATVALALFFGNAAAIVWLWYHGGNVTEVDDAAELVTSLARLTGFLAAYLALVQVLLLARIPWLDRLVGFDHLTVVHRWNGHATVVARRGPHPAQRLGLRAARRREPVGRGGDAARRRTSILG